MVRVVVRADDVALQARANAYALEQVAATEAAFNVAGQALGEWERRAMMTQAARAFVIGYAAGVEAASLPRRTVRK